MTHPMLYVVSSLIYLCCQLLSGESQTITVNPIGVWTEGEAVTLTCTISSYSGQMRWLLGSTDVASCNPDTCFSISTGDGAYAFGFDTTKHIFLWTINPVKKSNNGNIFKCSDGTSTANFTATVNGKETTATTTAEQSDSALSIAALCLSSILPIAFLVIALACIHCRNNRKGSNDNAIATARKLDQQPWKSELDNLIDDKIENKLKNQKSETQTVVNRKTERERHDVKLDEQPWKRELDKLIDAKIETQLKIQALDKQPWKCDLDKLIDNKIENGIKNQALDKQPWKSNLDKLIDNKIENGIKNQRFDALPSCQAVQLKIVIRQEIESWNKEQNMDLQEDDGSIIGEDVPNLQNVPDENKNSADQNRFSNSVQFGRPTY